MCKALLDKLSFKLTGLVSLELLPIFCFSGYSDPFCEVKLKETKIFRTGVKKKTLSPNWNESVTFQMAEDSGMLEIVSFFPYFLSNEKTWHNQLDG